MATKPRKPPARSDGVALARRADFLLSRMGFDPRESISFRVTSSGIAMPSPVGTQLAADAAAALPLINADPRVAQALTADDIYIHTVESSNTSYVADRFAFLSLKTIANIAEDSKRGMSFMTKHATPGMFNPGENSYGRTFAGLFEQSGEFARSLTQFYMLKSFAPNGDSAASTDTVHRGLLAGTFFDFSPGLKRGGSEKRTCDVCHEEIFSLKCSHCPGTVFGMTDEEIAAQQARGISGGIATFTMDDWRGGEISLVCDGAIEGVGTAFGTGRRMAMLNDPPVQGKPSSDAAKSSCDCCTSDAGCDCASNDNGVCSCHSDCAVCEDNGCGGSTAMASRMEEPMFSPEFKASIGLLATATDDEVTKKINEMKASSANAATLAAENETLKAAQKTAADAAFATAWTGKLSAARIESLKGLPNRDAMAAEFAAELEAAAAGKKVQAFPPIGDPLKGAGLAAAPVTPQANEVTEETRIFMRALGGKFKTAEDLAKFALVDPITALEKWLSTSGTPVTLTREPLHENFVRQTVEHRKAMLGLTS